MTARAAGYRPRLTLLIQGRRPSTVLFGLWLACGVAPRAHAQAVEGYYTIHFRRDLGIAYDIRFAREAETAVIRFLCEASSRPAAGSELELIVGHSGEVDDKRSYLTVFLNYGTLRSLRLDGSNAAPVRIRVPIDPQLLKRGENRLEISVRQYARGGAAGGVWTSVSADSQFTIRTAAYGEAALEDLPAPFVDNYSYRPQSFEVLQPKGISSSTLEATALMVASLCRQALAGCAEVRPVSRLAAARRPVLIAGTVEEHPDLARLPAREGVSMFPNPEFPSQPVLLVTGPTPHAVRDAARGFYPGRDRQAWKRAQPSKAREWPGYIPPRTRFSLAELGFEESDLDAANNYALKIPLRAPPDFRFAGYTLHIDLALRLAVGARQSANRLSARLNGEGLGEWTLRDLSGAAPRVKLQIDGSRLGRDNTLELSLREPEAVVTVLPSSRFYFPHDYEVQLPDLALLRHNFFPFSSHPDLSGTVLVVPSRINPETFQLVIETAAALGRLAPSEFLRFRLRRIPEITGSDRASAHFIYLRANAEDEDPVLVFPGLPVPKPAGAPRLQSGLSPWNRERVVLIADRVGAGALSMGSLGGLSGDTALFRNGRWEFLQVSERRTLRETFFLRRIEAWLTRSWYALPLVVTLVSALLYAAYRLSLRERLRGPGAQS